MADLKKSFDEVKEAATGLASGNIMTSLQKDVGDALQISDIDKPADAQIASAIDEPVMPSPDTPIEAETHAAVSEPLAITREVQPAPVEIGPPLPEVHKDAKAS
jgi:sec-independent protein translocase protein TatB